MPVHDKSLENWIWAAACSIRSPNPAKYKEYILPLIFVKRLSGVYDERVAARNLFDSEATRTT